LALNVLQVDGCTADLTQEEKAYCWKKRICSYHMRAEIIMRPGDIEMQRFCFQVSQHDRGESRWQLEGSA
jgi:hypothetical protein